MPTPADGALTLAEQRELATKVVNREDGAAEVFEAIFGKLINDIVRNRHSQLRFKEADYDSEDLYRECLNWIIFGIQRIKDGSYTSHASPLETWLKNPEKNLYGYIGVTTRNCCSGLFRQKPRHHSDSLAENDVEDAFNKRYFEKPAFEKKLLKDQILARLSPQDREILILKGLGYSKKEIADKFGMKETTAGRAIEKAINRFKQKCEPK